MSNDVKLERADFEAIMDRLESGPMNLTGKRWRDTPDDPALAELREHFILPVIEEYVARHKPQEREAVLEERDRQLTALLTEMVSAVAESGIEPMPFLRETCERAKAALTTPAPAVSRDDQALFNDICDKMAEVVAPLPGIPDAPGQHAGTRAIEPSDGDEA